MTFIKSIAGIFSRSTSWDKHKVIEAVHTANNSLNNAILRLDIAERFVENVDEERGQLILEQMRQVSESLDEVGKQMYQIRDLLTVESEE